MVKQILRQLQILGSLAVVGFSAGWADAQVASAPANFRSTPRLQGNLIPMHHPLHPTHSNKEGIKYPLLYPGWQQIDTGLKLAM